MWSIRKTLPESENAGLATVERKEYADRFDGSDRVGKILWTLHFHIEVDACVLHVG